MAAVLECSAAFRCDAPGCAARLVLESVSRPAAYRRAQAAGWWVSKGHRIRVYCRAHVDLAFSKTRRLTRRSVVQKLRALAVEEVAMGPYALCKRVAGEAGLSPQHICMLVREATGLTPAEVVAAARVKPGRRV